MLTSVIAVTGTLAGSALTFLFTQLSARRAERVARAERLRQERIAAYSGFAGAMADLRRAVITLWFALRREPDGDDTRAAHVEADQRGAEADRARFAVRLLTDDPEVLRLADAAFDPIDAIRTAEDRAGLRAHEERSQAVLTEFIQAGGRQLL